MRMKSVTRVLNMRKTEMKSEGQLYFERQIAEIEKRSERGEFASIDEIAKEIARVREEAWRSMTQVERGSLQRSELEAHQIGADMLADHGLPVPGNDPKKPN